MSTNTTVNTTFDAAWYEDMLNRLSKAQLQSLIFNICADINNYATGSPPRVQRVLDTIIGPENISTHISAYTTGKPSTTIYKTNLGNRLMSIVDSLEANGNVRMAKRLQSYIK